MLSECGRCGFYHRMQYRTATSCQMPWIMVEYVDIRALFVAFGLVMMEYVGILLSDIWSGKDGRCWNMSICGIWSGNGGIC